MKFTVIFKETLQRPRFFDVEAESMSAVTKQMIPEEFLQDMVFVHGVVDYDNRRTIPAVFDGDGRLVEVPDGDFGELTTAEHFADMAETESS